MNTQDTYRSGGKRLQRFPGYERARPVEEVDAGSLSKRAFQEEFVNKNRPVVIRRAVRHWTAFQWDEDTFRQRLGDVENLFAKDGFLITEPFGEYQGDEGLKKRRRMKRAAPSMSAEAFFRLMDESESLTAYAVPLKTPGLEFFKQALGEFGFVDPDSAPARLENYKPRMFLHKDSYTDWHYHDADETATAQLLSPKELLLLPTDRATFARLWGILTKQPGWEISTNSHSEFREVTPQRVLLEPGDAVYIPVFWWHAVESVDDSLGATLAFTFASPLDVQLDPRFAAARWNLKYVLSARRQRKRMAKMLLGACFSLLRHPFRPDYLYRTRE